MKWGTLQGVLGEPLSSVFHTARELGFDGVELDWGDPAMAMEGGPLAPDQRAALQKAASDAGVEISSVAAHFLNRGGIASPDPDVQAAGMDAILMGVRLCSDLGASVLLVPFFGDAEIDSQDGIDMLIQNLKRLAPTVEESNVMIGIEHSLSGEVAADILEQVGSACIGDYWDMGNAMCFGYDPVSEVAQLSNHLAQVHAKEFDPGPDAPPQRKKGQYPGLNPKPLGEGKVPIANVLKELQEAGYNGYIVLETGAFGDRRESAKAALQTLQSALESLSPT